MLHGIWVSTTGRIHHFARFTDKGTIVGPVAVSGKPFDQCVRHVLAWFAHDDTLPAHIETAALPVDGNRFSFPMRTSKGNGYGFVNDNGTITINQDAYGPLQWPALLDLNAASVELLSIVPGLGPARAARIVAHRSEHGAFANVDALSGIKGIPRAALAEATPWLTTRSPSSASPSS